MEPSVYEILVDVSSSGAAPARFGAIETADHDPASSRPLTNRNGFAAARLRDDPAVVNKSGAHAAQPGGSSSGLQLLGYPLLKSVFS